MRVSVVVALALVLASCGGSDEPAAAPSQSPSSPSASPSPSPSPPPSPSPTPSWDYCDQSRDVGHLVRQVRRGEKLPDELIDEATALRDHVLAFGRTAAGAIARDQLRGVATAVGKLRLAILDAGPSYPFDRIVELTAETLSLRGLTAALTLDC